MAAIHKSVPGAATPASQHLPVKKVAGVPREANEPAAMATQVQEIPLNKILVFLWLSITIFERVCFLNLEMSATEIK